MLAKITWRRLKLAVFLALTAWFLLLFFLRVPPQPDFILLLFGFGIDFSAHYFDDVFFWMSLFLNFFITVQILYLAFFLFKKAVWASKKTGSATAKKQIAKKVQKQGQRGQGNRFFNFLKLFTFRQVIFFFHYVIVAFISSMIFFPILLDLYISKWLIITNAGQIVKPPPSFEEFLFTFNIFFAAFFGILAAELLFIELLIARGKSLRAEKLRQKTAKIKN